MQPSKDVEVFIVDDDAGVREALAWLLRSRHLPSQSFESADVFLDLLNQNAGGWLPQQAGCLLLDVRMPGMTGLELHARMKTIGQDMPVIFMSGESQAHETEAAKQLGAVHFLWKPFRTQEMLAVIDKFLSDAAAH